jgi:hypothetical protein
MNWKKRPLKKIAELSAYGIIAGTLFAGCGGGGNTGGGGAVPSAASTALGSYIADIQGAGFSGYWFTGTAASATANTRTLSATASPTLFNVTYFSRILSNGSWSNSTSTQVSGYELSPTGWATGGQTGQTLTDNGDGINAVVNITNGVTYPFSIVKTSLAGSQLACTNGPCSPTYATYPADASRYALTYTSDHYLLLTLTDGYQVTNQSGAAFTSLPAVTSTFCDPLLNYVYQPLYTTAYNSTNFYRVYNTAGCGSPAIASALTGTSVANVTISVKSTGNTSVPGVLILTNWTAGYGLVNPWIYAVRAGFVWVGLMEPQGTNFTLKNKSAINAELVGSGFIAIP